MNTAHRSALTAQRFSSARTISFLLSVFSGILLSLPFLNGRLWFFAWVGFLPLFLALQNKTRVIAFWLSYLTGIVFWVVTIYWLIHVTLAGQILLILYLALYFGIFGLFVFAIRSSASAIRLFFIPSLWVFLEYLRAHLLSGFGWVLLGYSQYLNLPVIQMADLFGVYGVSFLVMMVNVAIWELIEGSGRRAQGAGRAKFIYPPFIFCFICILGYGYYKLSHAPCTMHHAPCTMHHAPIKISVIQGNIPQELKWDVGSQALILERYTQLTRKAALDNPDVLIWPEAASPGSIGVTEDDWLSEHIFAVPKETGIPLLFGSVIKENKNYFNSALLIDKQGKIAGRYNKLHLVPFGEYIPLKGIFPFLETIVPIGDFTAGKEYRLFKLSTINYQLSTNFAALICFEDTIPELSRNFVKNGADFLVNMTNDAWFKESAAPHQHLAASVFRAVENRVPLVRAANTGVSCFIDSCGRIKAKLTEGGKDILVSGVKTDTIILDKKKSLYQLIGDAPIIISWLLIGLYVIIINAKYNDMLMPNE